ncbi:hypothetical protein [Puniceibacterium confluentis]|uniref:hypothetical protein n=1 Tax=Puniceibacterium confluentis TaxID=1958944 RepID=UPI003568DBA4
MTEPIFRTVNPSMRRLLDTGDLIAETSVVRTDLVGLEQESVTVRVILPATATNGTLKDVEKRAAAEMAAFLRSAVQELDRLSEE